MENKIAEVANCFKCIIRINIHRRTTKLIWNISGSFRNRNSDKFANYKRRVVGVSEIE